jgi:hypothetical protein
MFVVLPFLLAADRNPDVVAGIPTYWFNEQLCPSMKRQLKKSERQLKIFENIMLARLPGTYANNIFLHIKVLMEIFCAQSWFAQRAEYASALIKY